MFYDVDDATACGNRPWERKDKDKKMLFKRLMKDHASLSGNIKDVDGDGYYF